MYDLRQISRTQKYDENFILKAYEIVILAQQK